MSQLPRLPAFYTHEDDPVVGNLWYFAPADRRPGPYRRQVKTEVTIDLAEDGTLAGIEITDEDFRRHIGAAK